MAKSKVSFKIPDFSLVLAGATAAALDDVGRAVLKEARNSAPVKTGKYRDEIIYDPKTKEVRAEAPYSAALEYGVQARIIVPKNKKVLKFEIGGETVFATKVEQKARPGRAIMRNAARHVQAKVSAIFLDNFRRKMTNV